MKKRTVSDNETSSRQLHRRQTRSNANSNQQHVEHEQEITHGQHKRHKKVRLANILESPTKKSPETYSSKRHDNSKADARLETPKSNKSSYFPEHTPFKDDLLLASQGYDTQCDVRWDCTSPDALRYIRKNRRRHHSSDVADIVQLLIPEESQKEDAGPSANTPPLLGLWQSTHASKGEKFGHRTLAVHSSKLVRFRKQKERARSSASRDVKIPSQLLEKLKLAVERCNEEPTESTEITIENEGDSKKEGFDHSKDLFASAEANRSAFSRTNTSPAPQHAKNTDGQDGDPDLSWSDDDMFEEDSFLMKATQDPGLESKGAQSDKRGNKRKSYDVEESSSKISKMCLATRQECERSEKRGVQSKGVIPYKMLQGAKGRSPSPFRKVKSFNDIDQVETKRASDLRPQKGRKCLSLRNSESVTKPKPIASTTGRSRDTPSSDVLSHQATLSINKSALGEKHFPTQGHPSVQRMTSVPISNVSKVPKNVSLTPTTIINVASSGRNSLSTKTGASTYRPAGIPDTHSAGPKCDIDPVCTASHSLTGQINISSRTFVVGKPQTTNSCSVGNGPRADAGHRRTEVQSPNPAVDKGMVNKTSSVLHSSTVSSTSTTTYRRRSSGMFDTSLSDDLLCQLAEPDELLESQASQTVNKDLKVQSPPSVGAASLRGKPQRGTVKDVGLSGARSNSSKECTVTGVKILPGNSSVDETRCADGDTAKTKQSHVISDSKPVHVGRGANSVIALSQVPSSQKSKFKFKSKSASSEKAASTPVSTDASKTSVNQPTSVPGPELNKLHAAAAKPSGDCLVDNSEDMFISDEDELSEQQILAMLDAVEIEATQKPPVPESYQCQETNPSAFPSKCSLNEIEQKKHAARAKLEKKKIVAVSPETQSLNTSQTKLSPSKYTQVEIERKKQAALEKRRVKMKETSPNSSNVINIHLQDCAVDKHVSTKISSTIPCSSSVSPVKYQHEDIERKRLAALEKLKLREETTKNKCAGSVTDGNSLSPVKTAQDEIEQKKRLALERQKHASGEIIKVRHQSDSSPGISSSQSAESSPFKCTPEEIEKKKMAALAKLKIKRNLSSQLSSNKGNYSKTKQNNS